MAEIVEENSRLSLAGDLKEVIIESDSAAATGDTVDTNSDALDGRGTAFSVIKDAFHIGLTGGRVDATWDNTTGIVTLGTIVGSPAVVTVHIKGQ